jgi:hypothetical protein
MAELGWTVSVVTHLQNLMSQGYMIAAELAAYCVFEDPASPALVGGYVVACTTFYERGFDVHHTDFSTLYYSSIAWSCMT